MKFPLAIAAFAIVAATSIVSAASDDGRAFVDLPLSKPDFQPAAVSVVFSDAVPVASVRAVTLHLRIGEGWLAAQVPPEQARGALRVPFWDFTPDGANVHDAATADLVRVSLWWRDNESGISSESTASCLKSAAFAPPANVAVAGVGIGADRCARLLRRIGVDFDRVSLDTIAPDELSPVRLLFLPEVGTLLPDVVSTLRAFVDGGGRLAVFYSADPDLSKLLGISPGVWECGKWTGFAISGSGGAVPHETENRICPKPGRGSRVLAYWLDEAGRPTLAPAVVMTPRGAWFAHVPPRAYPSACDIFRKIVSSFIPGVPEKIETPPPERVSIPSGFKIAAWAAEVPQKVPDGISVLFVRAPAKWFRSATHPAGVELHAWMQCLTDASGNWLDPTDPAVRQRICAEAIAYARAGAAGVHLDYVRTAVGSPVDASSCRAVSALVRDVSIAVKAAVPGTTVSAAVFPTPAASASVNQDWPSWVRDGTVDFVSPMIYSDDPEVFRAELESCLAVAPASSILPGIGTGADESQVDETAAAAELSAAVSAGCLGTAFFRLDPALPDTLRDILPSR